MLARGDEVLEALELVASDIDSVCSALKRQILQEVGVEVLLKGKVANKAHSADAAVEFNSLENFDLGSFGGSVRIHRKAIRLERMRW